MFTQSDRFQLSCGTNRENAILWEELFLLLFDWHRIGKLILHTYLQFPIICEIICGKKGNIIGLNNGDSKLIDFPWLQWNQYQILVFFRLLIVKYLRDGLVNAEFAEIICNVDRSTVVNSEEVFYTLSFLNSRWKTLATDWVGILVKNYTSKDIPLPWLEYFAKPTDEGKFLYFVFVFN